MGDPQQARVRRRSNAHARLEARDRLHASPIRRVRRGAPALSPQPRLSDSPTASGELRRILRHLSVEDDLRPRTALLRASVHHQLSHLWVDFRGIRDAFMRHHGTDYFENSRQATFVQQEYAVRNPLRFEG